MPTVFGGPDGPASRYITSWDEMQLLLEREGGIVGYTQFVVSMLGYHLEIDMPTPTEGETP
jgi:hypothetical protein